MNTNTATIDFPIWKTIKSYGFELDLVLVSAEELGTTSNGRSSHQPSLPVFKTASVAQKALKQNLSLPPIFASDQLKSQIPTDDDTMIFFIVNVYGEVMASSWFEGKWHTSGPSCLLSNLTNLARFVFVKPRKPAV